MLEYFGLLFGSVVEFSLIYVTLLAYKYEYVVRGVHVAIFLSKLHKRNSYYNHNSYNNSSNNDNNNHNNNNNKNNNNNNINIKIIITEIITVIISVVIIIISTKNQYI